jgi:hypothetical protein
MIDEVRDRYDELNTIIRELQYLSNDIKHYKDIAEQLVSIWSDASKEKDNVEKELDELEAAEEEELKNGYRRSVI